MVFDDHAQILMNVACLVNDIDGRAAVPVHIEYRRVLWTNCHCAGKFVAFDNAPKILYGNSVVRFNLRLSVVWQAGKIFNTESSNFANFNND